MKSISSWMEQYGLQWWMVEVFLIVLGTLAVSLAVRIVLAKLTSRLEQTRTQWDNALIDALGRPVSVLIWILGLSLAAEATHLEQPGVLLQVVEPVREVGVIATVAWFLIRFVSRGERAIIAERERRGETVDHTAVDAIAKLLRLSVVITTTLVALQTLGFSIAGVLTFGGVGGIAVGFAAKDLLSNFFGGLMVYLDRPFSVGDWIRSPDRNIEGTVEHIGWRVTRIRTFDSRPLYVPNATFANIALENPSRMQNRRIFETIGIRYDDATRMRQIVDDVHAMLREHPDIDGERTLMVNFNAFATSSLDFFIYCFTRTTNWTRYHTVKQEVLLKVLDIIRHHGAECAFPTSTLHVASMVAAESPQPG
jgi:MscS family membrane protein